MTCGKCKDDVPCDTMTGNCTVGCSTGYQGDLCSEGTRIINKLKCIGMSGKITE